MKHAPRGPIKSREPIEVETHQGLKCKGHSSRTRKPCQKAPIKGGTVCRTHGGAAPQVKAAAQERLKAMQPLALSTMEALMRREEYPTVQFQASKAVIDWTEGKAAELVNVNLNASVREMTDDELRVRALQLVGGGVAGGH